MKPLKIKAASGYLPEKKSINLATVDEKTVSISGSVVGIILVVLLAIAFSKFFVIDRLMEMQKKENEATALEAEVQKGYARLEELIGVEDDYAHYTLDNMTKEELARCNRVDVIQMMQDKVLSKFSAISWSVSENILTIKLTGDSLQQINALSQDIEKAPIVSFCTVLSAEKKTQTVKSKSDGTESKKEVVTATINAYLQNAPEEDDSTAEASSKTGDSSKSGSSDAAASSKTGNSNTKTSSESGSSKTGAAAQSGSSK
ncbi:MAG: hypothetical protein Q4A32_02715 [Lachnospiraceae bacterium]|nr:hypothetical protein [Lachnospiraceae bacterium]